MVQVVTVAEARAAIQCSSEFEDHASRQMVQIFSLPTTVAVIEPWVRKTASEPGT